MVSSYSRFVIRTHMYYRLDFSNPTILNLENTTWNNEYCIVDYNYDDKVRSFMSDVMEVCVNAANIVGLFGHYR
jgi:hypothetical protein